MPRDLRLLAGAVALSAAGDLLALIVLALRVHELTGSALAVSALFGTALVPMVVLAPVAGLVSDRHDRVRVLVAASLAQAAAAAALALAGGPAAILALSALLSAGNAFARPAEFTLIPAVAADRPARAAAAVEAARAAGCMVGPLLGASVAALGFRPAMLVTAATFLAVAAAAQGIGVRQAPATWDARQRALDGARELWADPVLRTALTAAVGALALLAATPVVQLLYVKDVLGASDTAYALVVCAWTAGMVVGAGALARRVPARRVAAGALIALAAQGAGIAVQTAWAILPLAVGGFLVGGLAQGVKEVLLRGLIAARTSAAVHGRAFAAYNGARNAAELAALGGGAILVATLGPRAALALAGAGPVVVAMAALSAPTLRRHGADRGPRGVAAGAAA